MILFLSNSFYFLGIDALEISILYTINPPIKIKITSVKNQRGFSSFVIAFEYVLTNKKPENKSIITLSMNSITHHHVSTLKFPILLSANYLNVYSTESLFNLNSVQLAYTIYTIQ